MRIPEIDLRYLHVLLLIVTIVPLMVPLGLPISINKMTRGLYDYIEALPPGSVVVNIFDWGPGDIPDEGIGALAITQHILSRPLKMISFTQSQPQFALMYEYTINHISIPSSKKYGVDYVFFGYVAGQQAALASIAKDMHEAFGKDYYGTPVQSIPMMKDIKTLKDVAFVVQSTDMGTDVDNLLRQWKSPFGITIAVNVGAVMVPVYLPYYPGQLLAVIMGPRGGAEYELLIGKPGRGVASMDAVSSSHVLVLVFMVIGNVTFFMARRRGKK